MQTYTHLSYSFDKVAKQVTITWFSGSIEQIKLITDLSTTTPSVIYDPTRSGYGWSLAGSVLTLTFNTNTASYNNADKLEIIIDPAVTTQPISWTVTASISAGTNNIGDVDVLTIGWVTPTFGSGVKWASVQRVTIATDDVVPVTDNSGSLTVDAPVATPVFVRLSDGGAAITTLPVSLASVPSHAVTNAGTFAVQSTNQANSWVDIGDVTINNTGWWSAVPIQDGWNSITVDGTVNTNNGPATTASTTMQNAATGTGNGTSINTDGYGFVWFQVTTTGTSSLIFEGSNDWGTTWSTVISYFSGSATSINTGGYNSPNGLYLAPCSWIKLIRARVSSWTSGTVTVVGTVTPLTWFFPASNANLYLNGTVVAWGNGTSSSGTVRVTLASDSTGTLAWVTNLSQLWGQAIAMGTGVRSAGTQRVTVATDDLVPTKEFRSTTPSQTSPSITTSSTSILASNANRIWATIYNESGSTCNVKLWATASATSYSAQVAVWWYYEVPFNYTWAIDWIVASGTATLRVTELT